jgi:copper chaperone CopZ
LNLTYVWHQLVVVLARMHARRGPPTPAAAAEDQAVYTLQPDGLACPFCAYSIEKQLTRIAGVESVETDLKSSTVVIAMKPGAPSASRRFSLSNCQPATTTSATALAGCPRLCSWARAHGAPLAALF